MLLALKELEDLSKKISKKVKKGDTIYLKGNLGTGKTTFAKFFIKNFFKINKKNAPLVTSPTFNIVQYYPVKKNLLVAHYDLYRLKKSKELNNIGLYDLENEVISLIEWPELVKKKNKNRLELLIKYSKKEGYRNVSAKYFGRIKK
jgi:tRNA threonylcarbamoyladenosine biosynthesis protein TsaE